jgi:cytochrome c5
MLKRWMRIGFVAAGVALAALVLFALAIAAQEAATPPAAKTMVPDNPSDHPAPAQPIPYSHKKHLAFGLECKKCHTNPEPGKLMTFPATSTCMECHVTIAKDKPAIQKLAEYAKSKQAVPWVRV